jgi:Ion channel
MGLFVQCVPHFGLLPGSHMLPSILLCLFLVGVSVMTHYETLRLLNDRLNNTDLFSARAKVLAAMVGAMVSHLVQIGVFAVAFWLLRDKFGLGGFGGTFEDSLTSFLYFSSETYTTLGFGDIYPTGSLRLICGFESLIGLLMVSWTASFTYLEMRRYW